MARRVEDNKRVASRCNAFYVRSPQLRFACREWAPRADTSRQLELCPWA